MSEEREGIIYGICHTPTNRWYIGQTIHGLEFRWKGHLKCMETSNLHLYSAMRKYGLDQFTTTVLEEHIPESKLDERECFYIQKYDSFNSGFNNTLGGQGVHGYKHTEEGKMRIGNSVRESSWKWNTPERARRISEAQKGREFTEEHRQHIKEVANRNKKFGEDNQFYGKTHTDYSRKLMSESSRRFRYQRLARNTLYVLETYESIWDAACWVQTYTKTSARLDSICCRLTQAVHHLCGTKTAYGFLWKTIPIDDE